MGMKWCNCFTVIGVLALLLPAAADAQTENKTVTITDPLDAAKAALYSGTYVYQGTRDSYNGSSGGIKNRAYYKCGSNYLYADYLNGRDDFPNGFEWVIRAGSIESRIQTFVYQGWESSEMNYPSSSGPSWNWWWGDMSSNEVTVTVSNAVSGVAPSVSTLEASLVTTTSGTMGGNVTADGGATTDRGFVYSSTDATPTIGESGVTQITKGTGTGVYTEVVSSLTAGVTYYYQAYGYNTYGTTYGTVKSFTTPATSAPNKIVSNAGGANGIYVWIGEYYGKPAWKHESLNYWLYYSKYGMAYPTDHYWYIDDELKDEHGAEDFNYDHIDAATCPSSGWRNPDNSAASVTIADYPQIDFTDGSAFSPGNATANTNHNLIGRFFLDADIAGSSLTAVTISASGTRTGVTNLKLWSSTDAAFNSGGDTQLNSQSDGATVAFSGFSSSISTSGTYYFITADLASGATGTFTLTIGSKTDLTYSGGASSTVFSNAALTSGSLSVIVPPTVTTSAATLIAEMSASLGGNVSASGGAAVSERGIVYSSVETTPTIGADYCSQHAIGAGTGSFSDAVGPLSTGTQYYFQAYAVNSAGTSYGGVLNFTTLVPEIDVQGNGATIVDGDAIPSAGDHTDFGSAAVAGGTVVRTFTIQNTGTGALTLGPDAVSKTGDADFTVTAQPPTSVSAGGSVTFQITFDAAATGTRSAFVSIANDDGNENPYNFSIQGTGLSTVTFTDGSAFVPAVVRGGADQVLGRFQLAGDVTGASLTAASIRLDGTRTGLSNLKLWSSADAAFGGDTQLGSTVTADPGDGGSVSFLGFSGAIATDNTTYFLTGDAVLDATGAVQGILSQNSSLNLVNGTLSGSITNAPLSGGDASLPVGLASFCARTVGRFVALNWITESETDNLGFILERSEGKNAWIQIASYRTHDALRGRGNTSSRTEYAFTDRNVESGKDYAYRLSDVSTTGKITVHASLPVKVDALPETTEMEDAYPNPFNPQTYIAYRLSEDTNVKITVFDMLGHLVKTLFNGRQPAGSYHVYWSGNSETGSRASSGVYFILMVTENTRQAQKVMMVK